MIEIPVRLSDAASRSITVAELIFDGTPRNVLVRLPILPFMMFPDDARILGHALIQAACRADGEQCRYDEKLADYQKQKAEHDAG